MSFQEAVRSAFNNYCNFQGRARRSEYWYFVLFNVIVTAFLSLCAEKIHFFNTVANIWSLAVLLPGLGLCWRRLHDAGKSGAYIFWVLLPLVGAILVLIKLAADSEPGDNVYGPNPKGVAGNGIYEQAGYTAPVAPPVYTVPAQEAPAEPVQNPYDSVPTESTYTKPLMDTPAPDFRASAAPIAAAAGPWVCPNCGEQVEGGKFCTNCGTKKPEAPRVIRCSACGYTPAPEESAPKFCPNCGRPM